MTHLRARARQAGIDLTEKQAADLDRFLTLVSRDSERFDLTSIRDPSLLEQRQVGESLALLKLIEQHSDTSGTPSLVDVGSGSGVPGLVLALMRPAWQVTLIEASTVKASWLQRTCDELGLALEVVALRAEDAGRRPEYREHFDLATAKAVAALPALLELTAPLLRSGGLLFAPKGSYLAQELGDAADAMSMLGAEAVAAPTLPLAGQAGQRVAVIRRSGTLSDRFPRSTAAILKRPLGPARGDGAAGIEPRQST